MSSILITGGAGFIGSHLTQHLLEKYPDRRITIVDDLSTGLSENIDLLRKTRGSHRLTFITETVSRALPNLEDQSFDQIYHLAAAVGVRLILDEPIKTIETNVLETAQLLRYAKSRNAAVLIASSSEVYGKSNAIPFSEGQDVVYGSTTFTRWSYACTKALDEYLALAYWNQHRLPAVIARFFNTVGPRQVGDYGMVLPRFVKAALTNEPLRVYGNGSQIRCFCDVRDVVRVLPELLHLEKCHGYVFNIGNDQPITIKNLAELVIDTLGSDSTIEFVPYEEAYAAGFEDLAARQPDLSRLNAATGFEPSIALTSTILEISRSLRN